MTIAFALAKATFLRELRLFLQGKIVAIIYGDKGRKTERLKIYFQPFASIQINSMLLGTAGESCSTS